MRSGLDSAKSPSKGEGWEDTCPIRGHGSAGGAEGCRELAFLKPATCEVDEFHIRSTCPLGFFFNNKEESI